MDFTVYTDHTGGLDRYSGDNAKCLRDRNVLLVKNNGREILYGPNGWVRVESDQQVRSVASCEVEVYGSSSDADAAVSVRLERPSIVMIED